MRIFTYVEEIFVGLAFCRLFLKIHVADRVDDQDLAILSDGALLCANRAACQLGFDRRADTLVLGLLSKSRVVALCGAVAATVLLLLPFHRTLLLPVPLHALFVVGSLRARSGGAGLAATKTGDVCNAGVLTPCGASGVLDEALDIFAVVAVAHVERDIVDEAAEEEEQTDDDRAETWAETRVVVASASPCREAIVQEVIVALPLGTTQDVDDQAQTLEAGRSLLGELVDLALGGLLVLVHMGGGLCVGLGVRRLGRTVGREPIAAGLVGVQRARELAVGLCDLVVVGTRLDAGEVVESDIGALGGLHLVLQTEDLMVLLGPGGGNGGQAGDKQDEPGCEVHDGQRWSTWAAAGWQSGQGIAALAGLCGILAPRAGLAIGLSSLWAMALDRGTLERETVESSAMFRRNKTPVAHAAEADAACVGYSCLVRSARCY